MKYFHLVWSALMRRRTRTILTLVSIMAAFMLFGLLDSVHTAFTGTSDSGTFRLVTVSQQGFEFPLPVSLAGPIGKVPGVKGVIYTSFLNGIYRDELDSFPTFAVSDNYFAVMPKPDFVLPANQMKVYARTRMGALVGADLAKRNGWKIGQQIAEVASQWPQRDGSDVWTFDIVGIFKTPKRKSQEDQMFFHWDYFDAARVFGNGKVDFFTETLKNRKQADRVAHAIDAISTNSDHETTTESTNAFKAQFLSQIGNIGLMMTGIMGAVFFTLLLLTGNTMTQAVRERTSELAVLKTLGFSSRLVLGLVLAESVALLLVGGVSGLVLTAIVIDLIKLTVGSVPMANVGWQISGSAVALMIVIGLIVGALPAVRGMRLKIVDSLAGR